MTGRLPALREPAFRNLFMGQALSRLGDRIAPIALAFGVIVVDAERYSEDDLLPAIEAGALDIGVDDDVFEVITEPSEFQAVRAALEDAGIELQSAEVTQQPTTRVPLDEDQATKLIRLIDALEDNDDVGDVHANFDVDADVLERVAG